MYSYVLAKKISSKVDFISITSDNKNHVSSFFLQLLFQWLISLLIVFLLSLHCGNSVNRVFTKVNSDHDLPVKEKMVANYSQFCPSPDLVYSSGKKTE